MKKMALLILFVFIVGGCAGTDKTTYSKFKPPDPPSAQIGVVSAYKYLKYSGKVVQEELAIKVDDNDNTILLTGENQAGEIAIYLDNDAREELVSTLLEIQEVGAIAANNPVEVYKYTWNIVTSDNSVAPSNINLSYDLHESGKYWVCIMELSGYDINTMTTPHMGIPEGRSVRLFLAPEAVENLLSLIEKAHSVISKEK